MPSSSSLRGENGLIGGCLLFASVPPKKITPLMLQQGIVSIIQSSKSPFSSFTSPQMYLQAIRVWRNAMWCMKNDKDNLKATTRFKSLRMSWKWIHSHFLSSGAQTVKSKKKHREYLRKLCWSHMLRKKNVASLVIASALKKMVPSWQLSSPGTMGSNASLPFSPAAW